MPIRSPFGGNTRRVRHRVDSTSPMGARPGSRYDGLDAMRAGTMLLVVALHAGLAYARVPIPNLIWAVRDPSAQAAFDGFCWWALGISSPFYLLSGFFAAGLYASRGPRQYMKNRVTRIVVPFLVAAAVILPLTFFVWVYGWLVSGQCTVREIQRMKFHAPGFQRNLYGPAHLWSLEYLLVMLGAYWVFQRLRERLSGRLPSTSAPVLRILDRGLTSAWRPLWLALPTVPILLAGHNRFGIDAIMDRQNSFAPEPIRLLYNAVFFAAGVALYRARHDLARFAHLGMVYLALSVPVFAARAWLIARHLAEPLEGPAVLAMAASGALLAWLTTFGLLGVTLRHFDRPSRGIRYLADSSYWIYLIHLPVIGLVQIGLVHAPMSATPKFLVVLASTLAIGLASYEVLVRYSFVGLWLHGRRDRQRPTEATLPAPRVLGGRHEPPEQSSRAIPQGDASARLPE